MCVANFNTVALELIRTVAARFNKLQDFRVMRIPMEVGVLRVVATTVFLRKESYGSAIFFELRLNFTLIRRLEGYIIDLEFRRSLSRGLSRYDTAFFFTALEMAVLCTQAIGNVQ